MCDLTTDVVEVTKRGEKYWKTKESTEVSNNNDDNINNDNNNDDNINTTENENKDEKENNK